ncbi:MAG: NAD(P)/FAD-dependent oxidoreductase [Prevotellaceae bacterium]|jgi:uncharacterized FAD-dependent dehydrogenase|nr:NAD(P)/FAD-dependent oxidoreductase [Prevotellaceae bacterium]
MQHKIQITVLPHEAADKEILKNCAAQKLKINIGEISDICIERKSIDARSRQPKINLSLNVFCGEKPAPTKANFNYHDVKYKPEILIIGSGPAGLFAALRLIELDFKPVIIERGQDVSNRKKDIAAMIRNKTINTQSNYCYGEGGAGTFSDGKLYTRSNKRGNVLGILQRFHFHGAHDEILYEAHPHIGTDKLPEIVKNMTRTIIDCGGEIYFDSKVDDIIVSGKKIESIKCSNGNIFKAKALILATGHSARDIYELLDRKNIKIQAKNFAAGVRVEHPQSLINSMQYHSQAENKFLPAASYSLTAQVQERGVYSFCMCPGGYIVPASTAADEIVVNGMSSSRRHTPFANSGIIVEIRIEDLKEFEHYKNLCGLKFQQQMEKAAFENGGGGQIAPAQRLSDFVNSKYSSDLPRSSYLVGLQTSPLYEWLPQIIRKRLQEAFKIFDKKMRGYLTNEALIAGVESRSSSPICIPRNDNMQHVEIEGLFPCGEGAGYAGGITSSAMDGEKCAENIAEIVSRSL